EVDAVDCLDGALAAAEEPALHGEMLGQLLDAQQRRRTFRAAHRTFCSSGERQQAEKWPGLTSASGGSSARQRSIAKGQRGWKRQPCGGASGFGTTPSIVVNRCCDSCSFGIEPSRPTV